MPKDEWGVKRVCPHCAARFYDLMRDPMTCPSCGEEFTVASLTAPKSKAPAAAKADATKSTAAPTVEDDDDADVVLADDDDDDDVVISDDLLEEDDEEENVSLEDIADVADDKDE